MTAVSRMAVDSNCPAIHAKSARLECSSRMAARPATGSIKNTQTRNPNWMALERDPTRRTCRRNQRPKLSTSASKEINYDYNCTERVSSPTTIASPSFDFDSNCGKGHGYHAVPTAKFTNAPARIGHHIMGGWNRFRL